MFSIGAPSQIEVWLMIEALVRGRGNASVSAISVEGVVSPRLIGLAAIPRRWF
jgi:hypothetical protein